MNHFSSRDYLCNICERVNIGQSASREGNVCVGCGATARTRALRCAISEATHALAQFVDAGETLTVDAFLFADAPALLQHLNREGRWRSLALEGAQTDPLDVFDSVPHQTLDLIVVSEILCYTSLSPHAVLRKLHGLLRRGGYLVLTVPTYAIPLTVERYPSNADIALLSRNGLPMLAFHNSGSLQGFDLSPDVHMTGKFGVERRIISTDDLEASLAEIGYRARCVDPQMLHVRGAAWPPHRARGDLDADLDGFVYVCEKL